MIPVVADEVTSRIASRIRILATESPETLEERLSECRTWELPELLRLTRLPPQLADREPPRQHLNVAGVDHRLHRMLLAHGRQIDWNGGVHLTRTDLSQLDDDDLLAAGRYIPETLPGYMLG